MQIKHLALALTFLTLAGCGCGDSPPPIVIGPAEAPPVFDLSVEVPPCEFPCTPTPECKIDVVFALDDSEFMNRAFGMAAGVPLVADSRSRSVAAQRIFADTQARLLQKINAAKTAGTIPQNVQIDLAFAVVRHEDFGGTTVDYQGNAGVIDANARPYMLQMPLLRQLHPSFAANFAAALAEPTLGNGNPVVAPNALPFQDPQSTIEMLHQVATGAGIDGNLANGTLDNGAPCSATAKGTTPGTFIDVPATTYQANGNDPQDATRPLFLVRDENGAGLQTCIASGNEGGVGFRPNSLRWVIFASDIASVAPFRNASGNPADPSINADAATVSTGFGSVPANAFHGVTGRFGAAGGQPNPPVGTATFSPAYAAGIEQTMNELTGAGIEVMALGALGTQPGQTKPNVPGVDPSRVPAILSPSNPDFTPFTMESAISILTGSEVTDETNPGNPGPFPAVFNLGTVGAVDPVNPDPLVPTMAATIVNDDLLNALVERIAARIANKEIGTGTADCPQLPVLTANVTFTLTEALADGTTNYLRNAGANPVTVPVVIPSYYRDTTTNETFTVDAGGTRTPFVVPASQVITLADAVQYILRDPSLINGSDPLPVDMLAFTVSAAEASITNQTTPNAGRVAELRRKLTLFAGAGQLQINSTRFQPQAVPDPASRGVVLLPGATSGYCLIFQDLTWGAVSPKPSNVPFVPQRVGTNCPPIALL